MHQYLATSLSTLFPVHSQLARIDRDSNCCNIFTCVNYCFSDFRKEEQIIAGYPIDGAMDSSGGGVGPFDTKVID